MSCKLLYTVLMTGIVYASAGAQMPGSFDPTFGTDGKTLLPIGTAQAFGRSMAIQPDGKTIVACVANNGTDTDFALVRFTTEGDPDQSLDGDGIVLTDFDGRTDIAEAIVLDESNRIIVAGSVDSGDGFAFGVARYLSDGTPDESFGDHGLVTRMIGLTGFCKSIGLQSDQKVVVGGYVLNDITQTNEFVLMRFNPDGTPDSTFNGDGIVMTNMGIGAGVANAMLIQPDDKIVLAGQALNEATFRWEIAVARYHADGTPDTSWDEDGIVFTGSMDADYTIRSVAMQEDRKIVVGGFFGTAPSDNLFTVARYHPGGELDDTFGDGGVKLGSYGAQDNQINTIVIQPDGQILIAGTSLMGNRDFFAVARLHPDGNFDDTFGENGVVRPVIELNDGIHSISLQQDGKLVVAGESFNGQRFSIAVARIETGLTTSVEDPFQDIFETTVYPNPVAEAFTVSYELNQPARLRIVLMDISGRIVHTFADRSAQDAGAYRERFVLPGNMMGGVYFLSLSSGKYARSKKVVIP